MVEVLLAEANEVSKLVEGAPGDPGARRALFHAFYERHRDEIFGFLVRLVRDRALAEDVLQDAFLRVFVNLDRFDATRPLRPWLFEIVRNAGLDALRRRHKAASELSLRDQEPARPDEVQPEAQRREAAGEARAVLAHLPDDTRALLVQRHSLGMTLEEMAESWQCTERTMRNRLRAAADVFARELLARRSEGGRS